jgi:hypothetical protein
LKYCQQWQDGTVQNPAEVLLDKDGGGSGGDGGRI